MRLHQVKLGEKRKEGVNMDMTGSGMTKEELAAIRERETKASPGPWRVVGKDSWKMKGFPQVEMNTPSGDYFPVNFERDAQFIAHTREDIPRLLDEIDHLQTCIRMLLEEIEQLQKCES